MLRKKGMREGEKGERKEIIARYEHGAHLDAKKRPGDCTVMETDMNLCTTTTPQEQRRGLTKGAMQIPTTAATRNMHRANDETPRTST